MPLPADQAPLTADQENELARLLQGGVPFEPEPFRVLGASLGLSSARVLAQLKTWRAEDKLREISAVLEGSLLGYDSALVAGRIPPEDLDRVGAVISAHPTVTHNYVRDHEKNLWFTIAVPREQDLDRTLEFLAREAEVSEPFQSLRRTKTFKIGVNFDLKTKTSRTKLEAKREMRAIEVSEGEKALFRALQTPLPYVERPFALLAEAVGSTEEELLAFARKHLGNALRRYVGTFRHRKLGVSGNGMGVWRVPLAREAEVGLQLAAAPEVTHCYARNAIEGFPFSVYSMIHGPDREAVLATAARLAEETGVAPEDYVVLFSTRELKKTRLRYFLPELDAWWEERCGGVLA